MPSPADLKGDGYGIEIVRLWESAVTGKWTESGRKLCICLVILKDAIVLCDGYLWL